MNQTVLVLDFGGQYSQLITRRVRELNVYCELLPYSSGIEKIKQKKPIGIILSGGPSSVYQQDAPSLDKGIFELGIPILGICYGAQLIATSFGGTVKSGNKEFGKQTLDSASGQLMKNISSDICWMSHTDYIENLPNDFLVSAKTNNCPVAAFENSQKKLYGVQFHPEVVHTKSGTQILKIFGATGDYDGLHAQKVIHSQAKSGTKGSLVAA